MAVSLYLFRGPNESKFKVAAPRNVDAELVWRATISPKFMAGRKMQAFCSQFQMSPAEGRKRSCWKQKLPTDCEILELIHPASPASRAVKTRAWKAGEKHAMDKQRLVEQEVSAHSILHHRSNSAFNQTKRAKDKAYKEHFRKGKRPKTPSALTARENARQLIRKHLGKNTAALPAVVITAPTRKRHKIAEGWFHPSEKLHISQIRALLGGPATIPEAKRRIVTVINNKLQLAGLQQWQFKVECRAAKQQGWFNAKIGLPGPTYVANLAPYLRKLFPTWIIKAGVNKWYEQKVWSPLSTCVGDALRAANQEGILRSLILNKALVWPVQLCVFIDGWKRSLFFKMKLIASHPCFEYGRELHTTSQIIPWQGYASAGENNLKRYSKFSLEVEDVLGRILPVETERGPIDCLVTPGSWSLDNKALWYALGLSPGSCKDSFRRGSVPYMWGRSLFLGPAIFTVREHLDQAQVFFQLIQAHIFVEIKSQGGSQGSLQDASPAMMKRATDYAKLLVGQKYDRSPLIANSQQGPESPLQAMLVVPALLHAIIHQVESTIGLAAILFKNSHGFLLTENSRLQKAVAADQKPKAAYIARKLCNFLGTDFAGWLHGLDQDDPRRVYRVAFRLHALFVRRVYDGQPFTLQRNFRTLVYSTFSTLLFNDLAQRVLAGKKTKNTLLSVHWAHMYSFAAVEFLKRLILAEHSEERFEGAFAAHGAVLTDSRQSTALVRFRQNWGLKQAIAMDLGGLPRRDGTGWTTIHRNFMTLHDRDLMVAIRCCGSRLFPRFPAKVNSVSGNLNDILCDPHGGYRDSDCLCECWNCVETPVPEAPDAKAKRKPTSPF
jgi:hypothetical protein